MITVDPKIQAEADRRLAEREARFEVERAARARARSVAAAATKPVAIAKPPTPSVASIPAAPQRQHVASPVVAAAVVQSALPQVDARAARLAEAKANASLYARMTGRRREVVPDHRPPPVSEAHANVRRFRDVERRRRGLPARTGL